MTKCPKCNSRDIAGPRYVREYGAEMLKYRCVVCGYDSTTQTADARGDRTPSPYDLSAYPSIYELARRRR